MAGESGGWRTSSLARRHDSFQGSSYFPLPSTFFFLTEPYCTWSVSSLQERGRSKVGGAQRLMVILSGQYVETQLGLFLARKAHHNRLLRRPGLFTPVFTALFFRL